MMLFPPVWNSSRSLSAPTISFLSSAGIWTSSENVEIPETVKVFARTSAVEAALADTVTAPPDKADTDKLSPKLIVPAVPTVEPLFLIIIPVPDAITPVSPEPSPTNFVAVTTPVILILPVPLIVLLNKSRLPPNCGVVSSTRLPKPPPPPPLETVTI